MDQDQRHTAMFALLSRLNNRVTEARRAFQIEHPLEPLPSRTSFYRARTKPLVDGPLCAEVIQFSDENPRDNLRKIAFEFDISVSTTWRMLSKEKQPYKKNKCHRLRLRHFLPRLTFCQWGLNQLRQNPDFFYDVCFTDESIFTSDGPRNQQTELMWMPKGQNPHWVDERNNYPDFKIMVFAGIVHDRIIGPYFFETNINSTIYTEFLSRVFLPQLRRVAPNAYWQQDGASPHNRRVTTELLNDNFPNRWMGLFGPIRWPAYSPDLTICDYGLWGDVKAKVKSMNNISRDALIENITEVCRNYPSEKLRRGREQLQKRFEKCIEQRGGLFQFLLK
ncbi:hypothetical protein TKK_0010215 [Trichogramma kaykai]